MTAPPLLLNTEPAGDDWRPFAMTIALTPGVPFTTVHGMGRRSLFLFDWWSNGINYSDTVPPISVSHIFSGARIAYVKHGPAGFRLADELLDALGDELAMPFTGRELRERRDVMHAIIEKHAAAYR